MTRSYKTWQVRGYLRDVMDWTKDGTLFSTGEREHVSVVFDPRGWEWQVTTERIEGRARITSLTIQGFRGQVIDQKALRLVPLTDLVDTAVGCATRFEEHLEEGLSIDQALDLAALEPGDIHRRGEPPPLEAFAAAWGETLPLILDGARITRRKALADRFGVTIHPIDKWTRAARDHEPPLIGSAPVGRPRNPQAPGSNRRPGRPSKGPEQTP